MKLIDYVKVYKKRSCFLLVFFTSFFFTTKPSFATTIEVFYVPDLEVAVNNAMEGDTIILSNDFTFAETNLLMPSVDVVIDGGHKVWNEGTVTVSGNGSATLTFKNLKIDGGAIAGNKKLFTTNASDGTLILESMEIYSAQNGAMNISTTGNATTIIYRTKIYNNTGTNNPPAIWLGTQSNIELRYSTVENNTGQGAGYETGALASKNYTGNLKINNTIFRNNINKSINSGVFGGGGGAISIHYLFGTINISESYFVGNQTNGENTTIASTYDGGAILIQGTGNPGLTTTITNSTFYNNKAYGLDGANYSGGAIQFFKNGGSSKMTNNLFGCTFVGNQAGCENTTTDQRGGAIGLSGAGLFATAAVTRNSCLFLGNIVYGSDGQINTGSTYKDISNNATTQAGTLNIINVDKGGLALPYSSKDILGNENVVLTENRTKITIGVDEELLKTIPIKPEGIADNTYSGTVKLSEKDQRSESRFKDQGAIEMSWVKYDANGGEFELETMNSYNGEFYYEPDSQGKIYTYYNIGAIGTETAILDGNLTLKAKKDNYEFKGWSTNPSAIDPEENYGADASMTYDENNFTLYAVWEGENIYKVTFEPEGGMFSDSTTIVKEIEVKEGEIITEEIISKEDYTFDGWYEDISSDYKYDFNSPIMKDLILYAKWKLNYTVTLDVPLDLEGVIFNPIGGDYSVPSGGCFSFEILNDEFGDLSKYEFRAYVNGELISPKDVEDFKVIYEMCDIEEDKFIQIEAEEKIITSNVKPTDDEFRIWSENNILSIQAKEASVANIYNLMGTLEKKVAITVGLNNISLPNGLYVLKINELVEKIIISEK